MRNLSEIRADLELASHERAELWESLAEQYDAAKSARADQLSRRIEELWAESRLARARGLFGDPEEIISRARAEERLERESRRVRRAA
jgi:hypothetical protein